MWFLTSQWAFLPHKPGQGSIHFWFLHALSVGQSELRMHSGRQFGGEPIIPGKQEQSQRSPTFLGGLEYGPQGFGSQGSSAITGSMAAKTKNCHLHSKICMNHVILVKNLCRFWEIGRNQGEMHLFIAFNEEFLHGKNLWYTWEFSIWYKK